MERRQAKEKTVDSASSVNGGNSDCRDGAPHPTLTRAAEDRHGQ